MEEFVCVVVCMGLGVSESDTGMLRLTGIDYFLKNKKDYYLCVLEKRRRNVHVIIYSSTCKFRNNDHSRLC
jgi:hypothetical protein